MCKEAKTCLGIGAASEASFWIAVWDRELKGTLAVVTDVLPYDTFVFRANIQSERGKDFLSDKIYCAVSKADFENKTKTFIKNKNNLQLLIVNATEQ